MYISLKRERERSYVQRMEIYALLHFLLRQVSDSFWTSLTISYSFTISLSLALFSFSLSLALSLCAHISISQRFSHRIITCNEEAFLKRKKKKKRRLKIEKLETKKEKKCRQREERFRRKHKIRIFYFIEKVLLLFCWGR